MPIAVNTESLKAGVINELMETWRQQFPVYEKQQEVLMRQLKYTNIRNASYPFKESLPFVKLWNYGMPRQYQTFKDRVLTMNIVPYDLTIPWSGWDEEDDQLGDMRTHVQMAVKRFLMLPDVLASEYFNGTADLNPSLLTAYDGVSLFSATDGDGAARFGATGGNIITGSGLTVSGIVQDFASVQQRIMAFVDPTAGKPIFSEEDVAYKNLFVIAPKEANQVFQKASQSEFIKIDNTSNTAESNYIKGTFEYSLNQYLTDTVDWYVVMRHSYFKPFAYRGPKDVRTIAADMMNSDKAREYNENALYSDVRTRLGPFFPACIIKVNNS